MMAGTIREPLTQHMQLARPPIQEAIIQFVFKDVTISRDVLASIADGFVKDGWNRQKTEQIDTVIDAGALAAAGNSSPAVVSSARSFLGYVVMSQQDEARVQLRPSSVSVSKTKYTKWEDLVALAQRAFDSYSPLTSAGRVKQVSTRFINRIAPIPGIDSFDEILKRPPKTTDGLPGAYVADFMRRHIVRGIEGGFAANLTVGTVVWEPKDIEPGKTLVVDIDAFLECDLPADFSAFTESLSRLRHIKNDLFFGSLTDFAVERYV